MSDFFKKQALLFGIIAGAIIGAGAGIFFPDFSIKMKILGDLFLNALKMMVIPIIVVSMISGITNLQGTKRLGKLGLRTLVYYLSTTGIAVAIGMMMVLSIKPGLGFPLSGAEIPEKISTETSYSVVDMIESLIHPNLFQAAAEMKILPIIIASILFGLALNAIGEKGETAISFFASLNDAVMKLVRWIMFFAPIGIFALIAYRFGITGGGNAVVNLIRSLGKYFITVVSALTIHSVIILAMILLFFGKRNPINYFFTVGKALLTAFATASSSATLPITMECVSEEGGVSKKTSGFVLPLGATINMDGTAMYEAVAAIFIAQSYGIELAGAKLLIVFFTATIAGIGAAGIPEAGLVTMVLVLQSVGLPVEGIGMILAIDWLLDRCRTTVNVWGDAVGACVIDYYESRNEE
ncbi:MAG: dicarboxylate/amino acid:cation symporter [Candidatus Schekmanbacteria bacterium]|nr:MAG: dicarboxylate/amino acid:cation symporter [Candidatus Schekmanbacteria bacterium]